MSARSYPSGYVKRKLKEKKGESQKKIAGSLEKYIVSVSHKPELFPSGTSNSKSLSDVDADAVFETNDCHDSPSKKLNREPILNEKNYAEFSHETDNASSTADDVFMKEGNNYDDDPPSKRINVEPFLNEKNDAENLVIKELGDYDKLLRTDGIPSPCFVSDPALWTVISSEMVDYFINNPPPQNMNMLKQTERIFGGKKRSLTEAHFYHVKQNGEKVIRKWLVLSESTKDLFCWVCKLFNRVNSSAVQLITGFNDWKHVGIRLCEHENSLLHRQAIMEMSQRLNVSQRIDCSLVKQHEEETSYWIAVLKRVVAVVKFLSLRGLPFFGNDETVGSRYNGNFLGCLEVVAQFDPFLYGHLERYGNPGKGNVNYLSSTSISEFIDIMGEKVLKQIIDEIVTAKYFSIIVDSTPDITHLDQLCFVVRYVFESQPVERFLKFIPMHSHKSENLAELVLAALQEFGIDILNCRGQSYDNASNMAGKYSGLQARIQNINPLAHFVPCAAHSLNLVGVNAVEACSGTIQFFSLVQQVYNFFSASTHRWQCLKETIKVNGGDFTLKNSSITRWCANAQAVKSIRKNYSSIIATLSVLSTCKDQNAVTRCEASGLIKKLKQFETALNIIIWDTLLQRLNKTNIELQKPSLNLLNVAPLYQSLIDFTQTVRDNFVLYENIAREICETPEYELVRVKKVPKSKDPHTIESAAVQMTPRDTYIRNNHYVICDSLISHLTTRKLPYEDIAHKFACMLNISSNSVLAKNSSYLQNCYRSDIADSFPDELQQFSSLIQSGESVTQMLQKLKGLQLEDTFPNVETALRILLTLPVSNCSGERSFSLLKRLKSPTRSTLLQSKLSSLALLCIEGDITQKLDYDDIIFRFASVKSRKKILC